MLDEKAWDHSTLPIKFGGLGIKLASEVSLPAYLSSFYSTTSIVKSLVPHLIKDDLNPLYEQGYFEWKMLAETENITDKPCFQSEWDIPIYSKRYKNLIDTAPTNKERLALHVQLKKIPGAKSRRKRQHVNGNPFSICWIPFLAYIKSKL